MEKTGSERAKASIQTIEGLAALRPSVEAGFHSLLDRFVAHSHSVYANLATCAEDGRAVVARALEGADYTWGFVPYTDPGARLTFSIRDELARVEKETGKRPAVIFMQNHGLIAHQRRRGRVPAHPFRLQRPHRGGLRREGRRFPGGFRARNRGRTGGGGLSAAVRLPEERRIHREVPAGIAAVSRSAGVPDRLLRLRHESRRRACAPRIRPRAASCSHMPAAKAQIIAETLTCVVYIAETLKRSGHTLSTMDEAARAFIANWESEKYRKSLAGKK